MIGANRIKWVVSTLGTSLILTRLILAVGLVGLGACTKSQQEASPVHVLEQYIQISFNVQSLEDKSKMEQLLTGETQKRLASWSNEQFVRAFMETKRKFDSLKVLENKKIGDQEVGLTYELAFFEGEGSKKARTVQRKLAVVTGAPNAWKIKEVRSIRESIEYLEEFSLP